VMPLSFRDRAEARWAGATELLPFLRSPRFSAVNEDTCSR
jgi:hypothetical protein